MVESLLVARGSTTMLKLLLGHLSLTSLTPWVQKSEFSWRTPEGKPAQPIQDQITLWQPPMKVAGRRLPPAPLHLRAIQLREHSQLPRSTNWCANLDPQQNGPLRRALISLKSMPPTGICSTSSTLHFQIIEPMNMVVILPAEPASSRKLSPRFARPLARAFHSLFGSLPLIGARAAGQSKIQYNFRMNSLSSASISLTPQAVEMFTTPRSQ